MASSRYETVIGLEVHAQLKTKSKIFCSCSTQFGAEPNENTCPVCAGMPGVLPVLNRKVVEFAAKMGLAVDCRINRTSIFARKNYFYPDLPKGYQTSQYESPICEHGHVDVVTAAGPRRVGITRIHMEEDAGKNIHSARENKSYVDLNRSCVPLIEIVSDPDMRSSEEAVAYLKALRSILVYLDICDGNMEEGSFRCDANVSVRPVGQKTLGTRTELKNLNSFKHVQKALDYEAERQADLLDDGEPVVQETRLYDVGRGVTHSMRGKEEAKDYRYFPCPDLVPLVLKEEWIEKWKGELPELPQARERRFVRQYGLSEDDAEVLTAERDLADYFEAAAKAFPEPKKLANWIMTDILREMHERSCRAGALKLGPERFAALVRMVEEGKISAKSAKDILPELLESGADPEAVAKRKGLAEISDSKALAAAAEAVIAANPKEAAAYRAGKTKLMGFFVGQVMRATKGKANPAVVNRLFAEKLK